MSQRPSKLIQTLSRAIRPVIENLEDRRLLSADPLAYVNQVQTLPFALDFTHTVNGLHDAAGQDIGFTRVQLNKNNDQYQPSLINLNTAAGQLELTTRGTNTSGSSYGTDNTHVNAIETQFDGTSRGFNITTRLKGPLSQLNAAYDQGAVYFGPDDDNYVKFDVEYDAAKGQTLQFTDEQNANTHTVNTYLGIGSLTNVTTLDLRLTGDAVAGTVTASYSVNGGTYTTMPGTVTLSGGEQTAFFNSASRAGIFASTRNSLAPITIPFGRFEITPGAVTLPQPSVSVVNPAPNDNAVRRDAFVSVDFHLPNGSLDTRTLNSNNVYLYRTADHTMVPAYVNTSGGGDALVLQPRVLLDPTQDYTFVITNGLKDVSGTPFIPYTLNFKTSTLGGTTDPTLAFEKLPQANATGADFTSVRVGPDHKLYASSEDGRIFRYLINDDGTLGPAQIITSLQTYNANTPRLITGFAFDPASTATNVILWVSNGYYSGSNAYYANNAPDFSSKITLMSGPDLATVQDAVVNLPRAIRDHTLEQPTFGPDGALYVCQGSNTAYGDADPVWGNRPEHLLNAAILRLDTTGFTPGATFTPLDAKTIDAGGTYNPFAAGAPLTIYASGVRNAFQLLWARDGTLFAPTNGSSAGGNTPGYPNAVTGTRTDQATNGPYTGPNVAPLTGVAEAEPDWLFKIVQGGYYGHPDPARGEYVLNGGNPTSGNDLMEVPDYPVGTLPDRNWQTPVYDSATHSPDGIFGVHRSPDGIIEYQGGAFGGALNGKLLVTEYSGGSDVAVLTRNADGTVSAERGIAGLTGFQNPVNITEDNSSGFLYVAELGGRRITLLRPVLPGAKLTAAKTQLVFSDIQTASTGGAGASPAQTLTITNTGTTPLTFGSDAFTFMDDPNTPGDDTTAFSIINRLNLPTALQPGQSADIPINFTATRVGIESAVLQIKSNDATQPITKITLRGIGTTGLGGTNEPSLARILRAFQIPTIVGNGPNDSGEANTLYPNPPDPSSQEVPMQRLVKAGPGPVTMTLLASYVNSHQPAVRYGYYTPGNQNDRTELFTIAQGDAQTTSPTAVGATSFDPGSNEFGLYTVFPTFTDNGHERLAYSEDALNTWDASVHRKMRFFPLKNADGTVVPNAYIVTSEDWNVQYDSNDVVAIIRNVQAAPAAPHGPVLGLENLDAAPYSDRLVFNRIQVPNATFTDLTHDTGTVRIRNTGDQPLIITGLNLSDRTNWQLVNPPTLPLTIAAGGTFDVTVKFIATSSPNQALNETNDTHPQETLTPQQAGGVWNATLTIISNDPNRSSKPVQLAGYWQHHSEFEEEPGLQTITNLLFGYGTTISNTQQPNYPETTVPSYYGEEVPSAFWKSADPSQPVTVRQLAAFHNLVFNGALNTATIGWYNQGSTGTTTLFKHALGEGQSLLPHLYNSTTAPAQASFNPTGSFGWNLDGNYSEDSRNAFGGGGHHVRFYPLRDRSGNVVPNTWLVGMDYGTATYENYDFQDNVYLVTNMRPAAQPPAPTDLFATTAPGGVMLQWASVPYSPAATYNVYRAASPAGPFTRINGAALAQPGFLDANAPSGVASYYRVTAMDPTTGTESVAANASAQPGAPIAGPATPANLVATAASNGITLTWTANTESNLAGYIVYRASSAAGPYIRLNGPLITSPSYLDASAPSGATSFYQVVAVDTANISSTPATANATMPVTTAPAAPTNLTAIANSGTQVIVSWGASTGATNYRIERKGPSDATFVEIAGNVTGTSYTDLGVTPGTAYQYQVRAQNAAGLSPYSAPPASVTTPSVTPTAPGVPTNLIPAPTSNSVVLRWTASTGTVTAYHVERSGPTDGGNFIELSANVQGTTYTDTTAQPDTQYTYRVRAENAGQFSGYATTLVTTPPVQRDAFTSQDIGATPAGSTTVITNGSDYDVVAGGPAIYGAADGFRYLYKQQSGDFDVKVRVQSLSVAGAIAQAGLMARETLDPASRDAFISASPDFGYRFKYRAATGDVTNTTTVGTVSYPNVWVRLKRVGNVFTGFYSSDGINWTQGGTTTLALPSTLYLGMAAASNNTTSTTTAQFRGFASLIAPTKPGRPTNLVATAASPTRVNLQWASALGASSYRVERLTPGNPVYGEIASNIVPTSYSDSPVSPSTTYSYRVRAENSAGLSDYSDPATVTTPQVAPTSTYSSLDLNAPPAGSTTVVTPGSDYNVVAPGYEIGGAADSVRFVYQQRTGDFDVKVQVQSITAPNSLAKAGLMVRESLTAGSPMAFSGATVSNGFRFISRATAGATATAASPGTVSYPNVWVRLTRVGNVLSGYYSADGITWTQSGSATIALPSTVYLGMAGTCHDTKTPSTIQFRNLVG